MTNITDRQMDGQRENRLPAYNPPHPPPPPPTHTHTNPSSCWFSAIFDKEDNFGDFLFAFQYANPFMKRGNGKTLLPEKQILSFLRKFLLSQKETKLIWT